MRFKSRSRALAGAALAATLGLAGLAVTATPAMAVEDTEVSRVDGLPTYPGGTRYETAAEAATTAYPDGSANVVLASGEAFPDALAGGGLAGSLDAPILLTQTGTLTPTTAAALEDLEAETVTILGGTEAVSAAVEASLDALGYDTPRVGGEDRFETAALIAEELGGTTAVLANGLNFPDALAISPGAHALGLPLLLTTAGELHPDAAAYIDGNAVDEVIVVGGTDVVSQDIRDGLEDDGIDVVVLAGTNRYLTAVEVAEFHVTQGFTLDDLIIARGDAFPDALAAGPLGSQMGNPLVLTQSDVLSPATADFITENCAEIDALTIMGGTVAITPAVADAAAAAAQCDASATSATTRPELNSASIIGTVTVGQVTAINPIGTTVAYTFDEPVVSANGQLFHVYNASATDVDAGNGVATIQTDNRTVHVRYPGIATAAAAAALTTATVDLGAVADATGQQSPEGDAGIGQGGQSTLTAGTTQAPDLRTVGGFRGPLAANASAVDFTFDQNAFVQNTTGFRLITVDGIETTCTGPAATSSNNTTPSGQNVVGGNGSTTITVTCPAITGGASNGQPHTAANTARGVVVEDTVGTTPPAATVNGVTGAACDAANTDTPPVTNRCNPLQASDTPDLGTITPDLVSATFQPAANTTSPDQVTYTFDESVQPLTADGLLFQVYLLNGAEVAGGDGATGTACAGGTACPDVQVNGAQVAVFFPNGTLANAVGASVEPAAVTAVAGTNRANLRDEVGVQNSAATTTTPGRTGAPDLTSVALASQTVGFSTTWTAIYTFDEALANVTAAAVAPQLFLHLSDGSRMVCTNAVIGTGTNTLTTSQVACTAYSFVVGQAGTNAGAATASQIGASVLGTVNRTGGANTLQDNGGNFTPEGAELTVGGTGTTAA